MAAHDEGERQAIDIRRGALPPLLQARRTKIAHTVPSGRNSAGSWCRAIRLRTIYRMASTITRRQCFSVFCRGLGCCPHRHQWFEVAQFASVSDDEYTVQPGADFWFAARYTPAHR